MAFILIVDDEPDIRRLIQINLELDGHEVRCAGDGAEALLAIRERVPDVMVLDVMMPELDGWGVLEAVKRESNVDIRTIPVLMLTALDTDENRIRGGIEGAIRYLAKPFSPQRVRDEVRAALEGDPEPMKRGKVQRAALEQLARVEKGEVGPPSAASRPRLTRFEKVVPTPEPASPPHVVAARQRLVELTVKQRELLGHLASSPSVSDCAAELGVSRSNVYASLRRISRKLGVASVPDLLVIVRRGDLDPPVA